MTEYKTACQRPGWFEDQLAAMPPYMAAVAKLHPRTLMDFGGPQVRYKRRGEEIVIAVEYGDGVYAYSWDGKKLAQASDEALADLISTLPRSWPKYRQMRWERRFVGEPGSSVNRHFDCKDYFQPTPKSNEPPSWREDAKIPADGATAEIYLREGTDRVGKILQVFVDVYFDKEKKAKAWIERASPFRYEDCGRKGAKFVARRHYGNYTRKGSAINAAKKEKLWLEDACKIPTRLDA